MRTGRRLCRALLGLMLAAVALAGGVAAGTARAATADAAPGVVPAQFVAKLYSEALGRIPDPGGWTWALGVFTSKGCSAGTVADLVRAFYTSDEFQARRYDSAARMLTLYRGALNREPDQDGLDFWVSQLDNGMAWAQVVNAFTASPEMQALVPAICSPANTSYYYGAATAPTLPTSGGGFAGGTEQQLQAALNAAPAGGTVYLAQKSVVRLTEPLIIPDGVILTTTGAPPPAEYARQGRLVRASMFAGPMVQVRPGAGLDNVWVDGQRGTYANYTLLAIDVQTSGSGVHVTGDKLSNSAGWSTMQVLGSHEGRPCDSAAVSGNLITAYSSDHYPHAGTGYYTDGLSIGCERATVQHNAVIDATDVAIVLFKAAPANQASTVTDNQVLSAGNSAYGAIGTDTGSGEGITSGFHGASLSRNAFWTGPRTHFDLGLAVGSRMWFGTRSDAGTGAEFRDNTTNGLTANVGTGIGISGMLNSTVQGNDLHLSVVPAGACPHVTIGLDSDGYGAGGDVQAGAVPVRFVDPATGFGCVGH